MVEPIRNIPLKISDDDFLKAFFPDIKETFHVRLFDDKKRDSEARKYKTTRETFTSLASTLNTWNKEGYGIFFNPNGEAETDKEALHLGKCTCVFAEIDEGSFEEQLEKINDFPLRPSIIVRTQKSFHVYWLLKDGDIKRARKIKKMLCNWFHSDPVVVNESRVMRFPHFYHCKKEPVRVEIIHFEPSNTYTMDEIESVLPKPKEPSRPKATVSPNGTKTVSEGMRVNTLVSFSGKCKSMGMCDEAIRQALISQNETFNPPLSMEELEREVFPTLNRWETADIKEAKVESSLLVKELAKIKPETSYRWGDEGNGRLFADIFKNQLRWNPVSKEYFYFNGQVWREDTGGMIASRTAKRLADALLIYAVQIEDERFRNEYISHVQKLQQLRYRKTMLEDARDIHFITPDVLDRDKYLLNVQNGVLNLKSFELTPHEPDQLLSKICNVHYIQEAKATRWEAFINEVMEGNKDKIEYLQKILGYSLTGSNKEETCFILYGQTTRNGKSTLVETISYLLGESDGYAMNMKPETLAVRQNNDSRQASGDIARLKDCRFLNASEPPKKMLFDAGLLKTLLGRDTITARFIYQSEFQFRPCFKFFMNTNYLPLITDDSLFSSGRINVITFDRHFTEEEQDKSLKDVLKEPEELSGILNWCLEGLKKYYEEGLNPPECVKNATNDYRLASDKIGNYFAERLTEDIKSNLSAKEVYLDYQEWCKNNGYGQENKQNFLAELRARGLLWRTGYINGTTVKNVVRGYAFIPEENFENMDDLELPFD